MIDFISIILAVLLLISVINSTYFFLVISKVRTIEWIVFNACAPSSIVFLIGFILSITIDDRTILHSAILPMFFFGGLGLFVFPWRGYNIIAQISHIIMVLNIGSALLITIMENYFKSAAVGMFLGIVVFSFFIGFQQNYVARHPEDFQRILGNKTELKSL